MARPSSTSPIHRRHRSLPRCCGLALLIILSLVQPRVFFSESGAAAVGPAQNESQVRLLQPGTSIERELSGGQSHVYQITLAAGQCLDLVIDQRGINVVAALLGPDGNPVLEFDSESRIQGQEPVSLVAEAAGSLQ